MSPRLPIRRLVFSVIAGCFTLLTFMVGTWTTATNWDHAGSDTLLSKAFSVCWGWAFPVRAGFVHFVGENATSIAVGAIIALGAPILLYSIIYFAIFSALDLFSRPTSMQSEHHKNI